MPLKVASTRVGQNTALSVGQVETTDRSARRAKRAERDTLQMETKNLANGMLDFDPRRIPFKITISNFIYLNDNNALFQEFKDSLKVSFIPDEEEKEREKKAPFNKKSGTGFQPVSMSIAQEELEDDGAVTVDFPVSRVRDKVAPSVSRARDKVAPSYSPVSVAIPVPKGKDVGKQPISTSKPATQVPKKEEVIFEPVSVSIPSANANASDYDGVAVKIGPGPGGTRKFSFGAVKKTVSIPPDKAGGSKVSPVSKRPKMPSLNTTTMESKDVAMEEVTTPQESPQDRMAMFREAMEKEKAQKAKEEERKKREEEEKKKAEERKALAAKSPQEQPAKKPMSITQIVMDWVKEMVKDYPVEIKNFSTSWADGLAFCALIHRFNPSEFDFSELKSENRRHNFDLAFSVGNRVKKIPLLLDTNDMVRMKKPEPRSVQCYVQWVWSVYGAESGYGPTPEDVRNAEIA